MTPGARLPISGNAIYFERTFRGARNLWKMSVDPNTLKATAIERLTTGPGYDTRRSIADLGECDLLRAYFSRRPESVEDVRRSKYAEGHRNRAPDDRTGV